MMMPTGVPFRWTCPYCNHDTTITDKNLRTNDLLCDIQNKQGDIALNSMLIVCPNPECLELSAYANLYSAKWVGGQWRKVKHIKDWDLLPGVLAKIFPNYIPTPILEDYSEACLIKELSPKASATLSRRCLQGMIRDFWKINKSRLVDEIEAIKDKIDPLTWDAIDAVRKVGNIGAHMEKDINFMIDVEPEEAGLLIELIETLINDWYINRFERQQRLQSIVKLKEEKEQAKKVP
jgi:hypothetical protein